MKPITKKKSFISISRKGIAFILAICLILSGNPGHVQASPVAPPILPEKTLNPLEVSIPEDIASIKETFKGRNEKIVFIIQDAHSVPDAQRNIQRLLDLVQKKYGVRLVALEGASSVLDPHIFQSFPDRALLQKVLDQYFQEGELAGGTAAAILNETPAIYEGVEDWESYEEGLKYFIAAMRLENRLTNKLNGLFEELNSKKRTSYSKDLWEVDQALQTFRKNSSDFMVVLEKLAAVHSPDKGSELALLIEKKQASGQGTASFETEVKKIFKTVRNFLEKNPADAKQDLLELSKRYQEFQTSEIPPEAFALFLKELSIKHKIPVHASKLLHQSVNDQRRMKDIQGTKLFDDFEKYSQSVKDSLFRNGEEKNFDTYGRQLEMMERLAKLEINRPDWDNIKTLLNKIQYWNVTKDGVTSIGSVYKLLKNMRPHLDFYRNAEKRDQIFIKQIDSLFKKHGTNSAAFVAGGFHAEGITYQLKARGISYILAMPKIGRIPEDMHYHDQMQGKVSWSDHFEIKNGTVNLYNGFVRGTRDLLLKLSGDAPAKILKSWRDEIIRGLAKQGRVADSNQYTRFTDEVFQGDQKRSAAADPWDSNVKKFMDGLRLLKKENGISEENILKLFAQGSIPPAVTAPAGLATRSELRADLIPELQPGNLDQKIPRQSKIAAPEIRGAIGMPLSEASAPSKNGEKDLTRIRQNTKNNSAVLTIGPYQIFIDRDLLSQYKNFAFKAETDFKNYLTNYFKEQLSLYQPPRNELVVTVLDKSENLFGSHVSDGIITIHRSLFEKLKEFPKTAKKMLRIGLSHELFHESLFMEKRVLIDHFEKQGMSFQEAVTTTQTFIDQNSLDLKKGLEKLGLWDEVESRMLDRDLALAEQLSLDVNQLVATGLLPDSAPFVSRYLNEERSAFSSYMKDHLDVLDVKHGLVPEDAPVYQEINAIFGKIIKAAGIEEEKIKLHVINTDEVTAYWATDSGNFFIGLGLIKTLQRYLNENGKELTQDMIAWVLAHEMRHLVQHMESKDKIAQVETKSRKTVSQQREYDADVGGLFLAAFAGYNPTAAIEVIRFLDALGDIPFMVDHPKSDNRLGEVQKVLQSPDQFLPNMGKSQIPFSEGFLQDPFISGETRAAEKYGKILAAKNLDELAAQIESIDDPVFFEEWMMYYFLSFNYALSFGLAQDPDFQNYMSFLLRANNIMALLGSSSRQPGRVSYQNDWKVPVEIEKLFRFFGQTQDASSSAPLSILGKEPHLSRDEILDKIGKKLEEDIAIYENSVDDEGTRKLKIFKMAQKQFRKFLAQPGTPGTAILTKSKSMEQVFMKRKAFASREEAEKTLGEWIWDVGSRRGDGSVFVWYIDEQALNENFEHFWEYFEDAYDAETVEQWRERGEAVQKPGILDLKEWFRKSYGSLEMPEMLFNLETDKMGNFKNERREEVEKGRNEFLTLYFQSLAFHFLTNKIGAFGKAEVKTGPAVPHLKEIQTKLSKLTREKNAAGLPANVLDFLTQIKSTAMFRGHIEGFDADLDKKIAALTAEELNQSLDALLSSPPYYLSTLPGAVANMTGYSSFVRTYQERFAGFYFETIQKILGRKAAATGLNLQDLQNVIFLQIKLENRLEKDIGSQEFKDLLSFVISELLKGKNDATLDLMISEIGSTGSEALKETLLKYLSESYFDKFDYPSKLAVFTRLFPGRNKHGNEQLGIIFSTVDYDAMNPATRKAFLENFLPLFETKTDKLQGISGDAKNLHQKLSYDYMMILKNERMGLLRLLAKMDSMNAVVTQFDLIVTNQKELKALSFQNARDLIALIKKSKSGYQTYQEALGAIALSKIKPNLPFARTRTTNTTGRQKQPNGKVEDINYYQIEMENPEDYKPYMQWQVTAKGQDWIFSDLSFEKSVELVLELFPVSKERDEILLDLYNRNPAVGSSSEAKALAEGFSPLEDKGELPKLADRDITNDEAIYAYADYTAFNVLDNADIVDVDAIVSKLQSRIPDHLKSRPDIQKGLVDLKNELSKNKESLRKAIETDKVKSQVGQFTMGGTERLGWSNSINSSVRKFVINHLIADNPHFDYFNLRNFGYQYDKSIEIQWQVYASRQNYYLDPSISLDERLKELFRLFPNPIPLRDNLIANMIALEENKLGGFTLQTLAQKVNMIGIKFYDFEIISAAFEPGILNIEQTKRLIELYKKTLPLMTEGTRQIVLGRKIFDLQKKFFPEIFQDFDTGLGEILSNFPKYSIARDSLLNEFTNMGSVRNFQQLQQVRGLILEEQKLTTEADIVQDAQRNEFWNTMNKLPSRKEKADLILWLLSPSRPLPESLSKLSRMHSINFDSLPNLVFSMTRGEREKFFYDSLRGYNGLFDLDQAKSPQEAREVFEKFTGELFDSFFTPDELGSATPMMRDIFQSIFANYSTERRILLFNSLLNAFIESRNQRQGRAQKIRTLLEQMGVIGVKVAQYLSEQPNLFKDAPDIPEELKALKKDAAPFHLRAIFQLLLEAGLLDEVSLQKRLGSASIKQVYEVLLKDGRSAAAKFLRPAAEKFLQDDIAVLETTLRMVNSKYPEIGLPESMVDEIREMILEELSFEREAENAKQFAKNLVARPSQKQGDFTIKVPEIYKDSPYVILEEIVRGITIEDLTLLQAPEETLSDKQKEKKQKLEASLSPADLEIYRQYSMPEIQKVLISEFFQQTFGEGFFHADLHYGNAMITPNREVYMIDLGATGKMAPNQTQSLLKLFAAMELGRSKMAIAILDGFLKNPISSNAQAKQALTDLLSSKLPLDDKFKKLITLIEKNGLGANKELAVYLKGLASIAPAFSSLSKKEKRKLVSSYLTLSSKINVGAAWVLSKLGNILGNRSELRVESLGKMYFAAENTLNSLKPGSEGIPNRAELRQIYEVSQLDTDLFIQVLNAMATERIQGRKELRLEAGSNALSTAAMAQSERLMDWLKNRKWPQAEMTLAVQFEDATKHESFLTQLLKELYQNGQKSRLFTDKKSEPFVVKQIKKEALLGLVSSTTLRSSDLASGIKDFYKNNQADVPIALFEKAKDISESMNESFIGLGLSNGNQTNQDVIFHNELLFTTILLLIPEIVRSDDYKNGVQEKINALSPDERTKPEKIKQIKAEYLKAALIGKLTELGYSSNIFSSRDRQFLNLDGDVIANLLTEIKAGIAVSKAA